MARKYHFPELPVLLGMEGALRNHGQGRIADDVVFVCVQHLLRSTGSLLETLVRLGANPANIFVLGKLYSSNDQVFRQLRHLGLNVRDSAIPRRWEEFSHRFDSDVQQLWIEVSRHVQRVKPRAIVVVDDGGHCITRIPTKLIRAFQVVGVEQTTSGLRLFRRKPSVPVVSVASAAVKKHVEAPLVAETVIRRLEALRPKFVEQSDFGVVGLGNIGRAVAADLIRLGKNVFVFDHDPVAQRATKGTVGCTSLRQLIEYSDVVLGCTGTDLPVRTILRRWCRGEKLLVSCSSENCEFRSLIRDYYVYNEEAFSVYDADIPVKYGSCEVRVLCGGFPINFDHSPQSVPDDDIQVTRALLLGAIIQSLLCHSTAGLYRLDATLQQRITALWFHYCPWRAATYDAALRSHLDDPAWIESESEGTAANCDKVNLLFRSSVDPDRDHAVRAAM